MSTTTRVPREGVDRCTCGSKYWDAQFDTKAPAITVGEKYVTHPVRYRCHSCRELFRGDAA